MFAPDGQCEKLLALFLEINRVYFDGFLDPPLLHWNSRLRSSAGRFIPGSRKFWRAFPPKIEVASYLREEIKATALIYDTVAHEMIHYWLWVRRRPYGHTPEFLIKMKQMGVSRYNPVPRTRPYKYLYQCLSCQKNFPTRKKLGILACAQCCQKHSNGKYDPRFKLVLNRTLNAGELLQSSQ
jgi:predicted SprT family Zn-dependent metalloprotease